MTKQWTLSNLKQGVGMYCEEDVKEFIKKLKINIVENDIFVATEIFKEIDKLAGDELK